MAISYSNSFISFLTLVLFCCSISFFDRRSSVVEASHVAVVRSSFFKGEYRTGYHFQPAMNWMNDPNGPMYYNGIYHIFYQYNPNGSVWDNMVWAHSVSTDMINWLSVEPAVYPSKWYDIKGCWTGSATILPEKGPVIMYTGVTADDRQFQCIALPKNLSDPYLREWVKPDYNPVILPGQAINNTKFRDPTTAWLGPNGVWRVLVGAMKPGSNDGMAMVYRSKDFVHWNKTKDPLHSVRGSGMLECVDFFPVALEGKNGLDSSAYGSGSKHLFKISLDDARLDYYTLGKYYLPNDKYVPENTSADNRMGLRFDYGNFYASKTFYDAEKKRRILWGWSNESDSQVDDDAKGWAGIQTIPRSIWLDKNGRQVVQWPIEELQTLRGKSTEILNKMLSSGELVEIRGIQTAQADVEVTFNIASLEKAEPFDPSWEDPQVLCGLKDADVRGGVGPFGLLVLASKDMEERMAVFFRVFKAPSKYVVLMCHDSSRSSLRTEVWKPSFGSFVDHDIQNQKRIPLRSLVDNSVVESFGAEGKTCITSRVYPSLAVGAEARLYAYNNGLEKLTISNLTAWEMSKPWMNGV